MGFADYAWRHPASFKRRKAGGALTLRFEVCSDGLTAFDTNEEIVFFLAYEPGRGYTLTDSGRKAALRTRPSQQEREMVVVEDRHDRTVTVLHKQSFMWDSVGYEWKPRTTLSFASSTTFVLTVAGRSAKAEGVLAHLKLSGGAKPARAELRIEHSASAIPSALVIFQAMMIDSQWSNLKLYAPLRRLSFSSRWL